MGTETTVPREASLVSEVEMHAAVVAGKHVLFREVSPVQGYSGVGLYIHNLLID